MLTGTADQDDTTAPATKGRIVTQRRSAETSTTESTETGTSTAAVAGNGRRADLLALGSYLLGALFIVSPILAHYGRRMPVSPGDRAQAEYFLAWAARAVSHGENPLRIMQYNFPFGVNGMANTTVLGFGIPLSPLTMLFGAQFTFDLLIVLGIAGTAAAWYWLLSRHLVTSRTAAWVGGLVGGFAPTVASHASYHTNLVAQFLVPLLAWRVFKMLEGRPVRNGLILAALVVYQVFINEETLFLVALGIGLVLVLYAAQRRDRVRAAIRPLAAGLGVTAGASLIVLAYPLYFQFFGPMSYRGGEEYMTTFRMDVLGLTSYGSNSVAERLRRFGEPPAPLGAEEHGFLGWGLVLLLAALVVWQWRSVLIRSLAATGLVFQVLAWGNPLQFQGRDTRVWGPFALLQHLPLFDTLLPTRLGEVTNWAAVPILALGLQRLLDRQTSDVRTKRLFLVTALAAALVPAAPMPIKVVNRTPIPTFVSSGAWQQYVGPDRSVLIVPLPDWSFPTGIFWASATQADMPISHGYFLGPDGGVDGHHAFVGPVPRPTDKLFTDATYYGRTPLVTEADRAQARADLAYWRTSLILAPAEPKWAAVRTTLTDLFGPGTFTGGLWLWDTRNIE
ncbi:DUF2079 domain-containing protein [Dactylosporangium matsuzakiense]|uniref:Glycosyl transferase n=1 Tax=Dactylosporangium matsuzakiense TaxID=53360 RepID=A0A9W6NN85_9ACTN|nr:DUF2079 domain-containing protein [Dactylosporangium matsuzakiense]UWZ43156.1 hypothetical protein Dmats_37555 [Dactylosporangium matsuzakiense]GLL02757.1 glycosyl transferase [Dactylosporangium matsuzakiense]